LPLMGRQFRLGAFLRSGDASRLGHVPMQCLAKPGYGQLRGGGLPLLAVAAALLLGWRSGAVRPGLVPNKVLKDWRKWG
jgi:hypothetical protein